jgi:23S rRNA (guanosine2251-2'-O)-methyltransferase
MEDSEEYLERKAFFDGVLTIYGRKPVMEALQDQSLSCHALHLASSNREAGIIEQIVQTAHQRGTEVNYHDRSALSRISKNGKQDQGVALDIVCPRFQSLDAYLKTLPERPPRRLLALDGISNPQNLGMIVRSAAAGAIDGLIWSSRGNAALGPLVIKASAGTLYRAPLLKCKDLASALQQCQKNGMNICTLEADADTSLFSYRPPGHCVFVLGNESEGVSKSISQLADTALSIPMRNGVESLNVAVTASLIAYAGQLGDT